MANKQSKKEKLILDAKELVARNYGFEPVMGTTWEYAMLITHRKKIQLQIYEEVLDLVATALERSLNE